MAESLVGGRYRPLRELGRGGMATVYLAVDEKHHRELAVKVFRSDISELVGPERFRREIDITAALNHPHILPLLDSGAADGAMYYVMPYAPGGSLRALAAAAPVPLEAVCRIAREVASALDHAHARGIIHRDVKPENILFTEGLALVSDFGIARAVAEATRPGMTRTGTAAGTIGYMSPEQALGTAVLDARTDVYSLGCVLYELLTGATPAAWPGAEEVSLGRFEELPEAHRVRLDALPGRVEQVLVRALALRPQHRYATCGELAAALSAAAGPGPRFSDEEVRALLRRAAELEAAAPEGGRAPALTIGAVEQIAAQAGIAPVHVRQAAGALERAAQTQPAVPAAAARWGRLVATRTIDAEVPHDVFLAMAPEIEQLLGIPGHASIIGGTFTWSPAVTGEDARNLVVQVRAHAGRTEILIREDLGLQGARKAAIPVGVITAGGVGAAVAGSIAQSGGVVSLLLIVPLGILGALAAVAAVFRRDSGERGPKLDRLADTLERLARDATGR